MEEGARRGRREVGRKRERDGEEEEREEEKGKKREGVVWDGGTEREGDAAREEREERERWESGWEERERGMDGGMVNGVMIIGL